MEFNVNEWRKFYDRIQVLGQHLKNAQPYRDRSRVWHDAPCPLDTYEQIAIQKQVDAITPLVSTYLDSCNMRMPAPLWDFDREDPSTWESDASFKFRHLMKPKPILEPYQRNTEKR